MFCLRDSISQQVSLLHFAQKPLFIHPSYPNTILLRLHRWKTKVHHCFNCRRVEKVSYTELVQRCALPVSFLQPGNPDSDELLVRITWLSLCRSPLAGAGSGGASSPLQTLRYVHAGRRAGVGAGPQQTLEKFHCRQRFHRLFQQVPFLRRCCPSNGLKLLIGQQALWDPSNGETTDNWISPLEFSLFLLHAYLEPHASRWNLLSSEWTCTGIGLQSLT